MNRMRRKKLLVTGGLLAVVCVAAGIAYAAIPSGNTITGCYAKNGDLRVIDATVTDCKSGETKLEWNQQGQKGDPGAPGTNGTNGTNGIAGPTSLEQSSANRIGNDRTTLASHTVTAAEAGLNLIWASATILDNSGIAGGATVVQCFLTVNGNGSGNLVTLSDNGNTGLSKGATAVWERMDRTTLVAGDMVEVTCETDSFGSDADEARGNGQLMLARVGS